MHRGILLNAPHLLCGSRCWPDLRHRSRPSPPRADHADRPPSANGATGGGDPRAGATAGLPGGDTGGAHGQRGGASGGSWYLYRGRCPPSGRALGLLLLELYPGDLLLHALDVLHQRGAEGSHLHLANLLLRILRRLPRHGEEPHVGANLLQRLRLRLRLAKLRCVGNRLPGALRAWAARACRGPVLCWWCGGDCRDGRGAPSPLRSAWFHAAAACHSGPNHPRRVSLPERRRSGCASDAQAAAAATYAAYWRGVAHTGRGPKASAGQMRLGGRRSRLLMAHHRPYPGQRRGASWRSPAGDAGWIEAMLRLV